MGTNYSSKTTVIAVILIIVGVLIVIIPWTILPVCEAVGQSSPHAMKMDKSTPMMKCGYSARAETGAGILVSLLGLTLLVLPRRDSRRTAGILAIGLGIYVILLPVVLTGVCGTPTAPCVIGTKPGWILLGIITILSGLILFSIRTPGVHVVESE